MLESLYRLTDLEVRFPLNLNVLDANRTPGVMSLKQALTAWLAFQIEVLLTARETRIGKIDDRLELLDGFLIAFLNLDRVIAIIRTEDEPKPVMIAEFALSDRQAEAILNMRLRSLRKLEEMEIAKEREALAKERDELVKLVESPARQRTRLKKDLATRQGPVRRRSPHADRGSRRDARDRLVGDDREGADHRHPVAARLDPRDARASSRSKRPRRSNGARATGRSIHFHAQTTDRLALFADNGRVYTLAGDKLPGGRGFGEPVRLLDRSRCRGRRSSALMVARSDARLLIASSDGRGFLTSG